jgi:hypothetical protein
MKKRSQIETVLNAISFAGGEADHAEMEAVVQAIRKLESPRKAVPLLFRWFEVHSEHDLGNPGPFVHFIEEELDYFSVLEESLISRPACLTVWMANRIANNETDAVNAGRWGDILRNAAKHPLADAVVRETALDFAGYQARK